jgi:hypothetical protein
MEQLKNIHKNIKFKKRAQLEMNELPEQIMACKHIAEDDVVLELGGSIGRNSCVINYILKNKTNHVVVEPSQREMKQLKYNRQINNFGFHIEESAISKVPLYSKKWYTIKTPQKGYVKVPTISYEDLEAKYRLSFTALVIDNEGNFVDNLKDFPTILDGIKKLIIEHDFNSNSDLKYFNNVMTSKGFKMVDKYLKNDIYGPKMIWQDGVKTDPIFVSVWKR